MGRKRRRKEFSSVEESEVNAFIDDICCQLGLGGKSADSVRYYRNLGWEGFLQVYREQPRSFQGSGWRGWSSAALVIYEKLLEEKRAQNFARYGQLSLDAVVSEEAETPLMELLGPRAGDHQNSVCFWDYLERLAVRAQDAGFLAYRLIDRETLEEIQQVYHWTPDRVYRAFNTLRAAMEEYLKI